MKRYFDLSLILAVLLVILAACGQPARVGNEETLEFDEQAQQRLGERSPEPEPTDAGEAALGRESPTPSPSPSPTPTQYFDIWLTAESPFYEAEGPNLPRQDATQWTVPLGFTLRVTNEDDTDTREFRTFTASNGDFGSQRLTLGQQWELELTRPGFWQIEDACCNFIVGIELTVEG